MKLHRYKTQGKKTLFDEQNSLELLSETGSGNPLEMISNVIDFEIFRPTLENKLLNTNKKNNAGAKPFDVVLMFKIFILQRYYGLGDKQIEYQVIDRISFKNFLDLETGDKIPDEKTVWAFRESLTNAGLVDDLWNDEPHKNVTKILMHDGHKKTRKHFTAIKIMQR